MKESAEQKTEGEEEQMCERKTVKIVKTVTITIGIIITNMSLIKTTRMKSILII